MKNLFEFLGILLAAPVVGAIVGAIIWWFTFVFTAWMGTEMSTYIMNLPIHFIIGGAVIAPLGVIIAFIDSRKPLIK